MESVLKTVTAGEWVNESEIWACVTLRRLVGEVYLTCASLFTLTTIAKENCKQINNTMNMARRVNSCLCVAGVIRDGVDRGVKTVCECPDVSMAPAISPGSAHAWTGGRADSVIKVIHFYRLTWQHWLFWKKKSNTISMYLNMYPRNKWQGHEKG